MASILELYTQKTPKTGIANTKGVDTTPIGADNPRGEFKPSKDLSKDEKALKNARGGILKEKKYSDSITKK